MALHRAWRAGWRILLWVALLVAFSVASRYVLTALPVAFPGWPEYLVLSGVGLLAGWAVLIAVDRRPPGALGFALSRTAFGESLAGFALGSALITVVVVVLLVTGSARFRPDDGTLAGFLASLGGAFVFFWIAAAYEEIWFRGYGFQALVEGVGAWPAILVSSSLFSLLHGANPGIDLVAFLNIFLAGVMLAIAYLRTRSLWFATALHAGWNWSMASLFALPVSGLDLFDTPLYDAAEQGADWWTGGGFGPEAGLVGTLAVGLGVLLLMRGPLPREAPNMRMMRPIVDHRLPAEWP